MKLPSLTIREYGRLAHFLRMLLLHTFLGVLLL